MALFPNRRCPPERCPPFEELMAERDRLFKKHPKTKFVAAHFGWHANDLGRLAKMFDQMPNLYVETGRFSTTSAGSRDSPTTSS